MSGRRIDLLSRGAITLQPLVFRERLNSLVYERCPCFPESGSLVYLCRAGGGSTNIHIFNHDYNNNDAVIMVF